MTDLLLTCTMEDSNGFTDDSVVSQFAFRSESTNVEAEAEALAIHVEYFWNDAYGDAIAPLSSFLSSQISRAANACTIRAYEITGKLGYLEPGDPNYEAGKKKLPLHGSPVYEHPFTLGAPATPDNLPPQIASVLTLRARTADMTPAEGPGGTRPKQRVTGRLYIGKLNNRAAVAGDATAGNFPRPDGDFNTAMLQAAEGLQARADVSNSVWCVWSRTAGSMLGIVAAEIDDSWDVIRSRKTRPTVRVRNTFTVVPPLVLGA